MVVNVTFFRRAIALFVIMSSLGAVSCNNVFHDLSRQVLIKPLTLPAVEYTYPLNGDSGVAINKFLVVSFTKDMKDSSLAADSFIIAKTDDPLQIIPVSHVNLLSRRVAIIYPSSMFEAGTGYTVSISGTIKDLDGVILPAGFSWSFTTSADADFTRPEITPYPLDGSLCSPNGIDIWVRFSEKMLPNNVALQECFKVEKSDGTPVPGIVTFDAVLAGDGSGDFEHIARFMPDRGFVFENEAMYTASIGRSSSGLFLTDLAGNEAVAESWHFSTSTSRVFLEDARNINNGRATFGYRDSGIGEQLRTPEGVLIADMFDAGDPLAGIFDPGSSGEMAAGRYLRIVDRWRNILTDLGLAPVMKYLSSDRFSPPGNQCYIDPRNGIFVLPRPNYWSKMDELGNNDGFVTELRETADPVLTQYSTGLTVVKGKFGSCIEMNGRGASMWDLYPFGTDAVVDRGTFSGWWNPDGSWDYYFKIFIGGDGTWIQIKNNHIKIFIDGEEKFTLTVPGLDRQWNHIYAVWDRNDPSSLDGGTKRIRVFVNGTLEGSCPDSWTSGPFFCRAESHMGILESNNKVDNIKIWKEVVSEDPGWEYRGGAGREKALHVIYGPDSNPDYDYRPKLTGSGCGVGFYYLP